MLLRKQIPVIAKMAVLESFILLVPLLTIPFYPHEGVYAWQFILPAAFSIIVGVFLALTVQKQLTSSQMVVFFWLYGILLAAFPFYLYGSVTFVQALFEAVSGFTTTGLSVLNVEEIPHLFLFYRGFLQYIGGLGFVMMMLVFVQEKDAVTLYQAEGHSDRLMPTIGKTVQVIVMMYGLFLGFGTVLYTLAGMPLFDGLVHTMCALSTGGFSNRLDSIGAYHSLAIEWITILLMMIGTTNFSLLLLLLKGRLKAFMQASEIRFLFGIILVTVPLMTLFMVCHGSTVAHSLETALFNAFSALSTTGYATCRYNNWPETALALMILLMMIGGGMGSTAGGVKLGRVCRLGKYLLWQIKKKMLPERSVTLVYYHKGMERETLEKGQVDDDATYAETYLILFIIGTIALTFFSGSTLLEAAFEFASSLGTVGLSIGITNIHTSTICLIIEMMGMILGRLEIFVLLQAIYQR